MGSTNIFKVSGIVEEIDAAFLASEGVEGLDHKTYIAVLEDEDVSADADWVDLVTAFLRTKVDREVQVEASTWEEFKLSLENADLAKYV
jgi:hypothetical protein